MQNKVLHIDASRLKSGGGVLHLCKMLEYSNTSVFDKIIVHTYPENPFQNYSSENIHIKVYDVLNKSIFHQILWQKFELKLHIKSNEVLFTIFSTSFCRVKKNIVLNQDIIGFQRGSLKYFELTRRLYFYIKYLVAKKTIKKGSGVIFTSNFASKIVQEKTGKLASSVVIPHGVEKISSGQIKNNFSLKSGELNLVYVSPILSYKNHESLVSAIQKSRINRKIITHFIGGGDRRLIEQVKILCQSDNKNQYIFHDFLDRDNLFKLLVDSDIALFLSSVECFGITLLEYMQHQMPIISSSDSCLPEIIGESALLVNPKNEMEIIESLKKFQSDQELRSKLAHRAFRKSKKYSWIETTKRTYKYLEGHL